MAVTVTVALASEAQPHLLVPSDPIMVGSSRRKVAIMVKAVAVGCEASTRRRRLAEQGGPATPSRRLGQPVAEAARPNTGSMTTEPNQGLSGCNSGAVKEMDGRLSGGGLRPWRTGRNSDVRWSVAPAAKAAGQRPR